MTVGINQPRTKDNKMKIGDIVKVFCKPITDEQQEGIAKLVQHFSDEDDPEIGERWTVRFVGRSGALEVQTVDRWVNERNLVRETVAA